ncbi:hypothetical protein GGS20DRAFT_562607 [Poronia punctata]|nr:hypothetical protein GGS20DRAFT_562607 [Poronia punctata]
MHAIPLRSLPNAVRRPHPPVKILLMLFFPLCNGNISTRKYPFAYNPIEDLWLVHAVGFNDLSTYQPIQTGQRPVLAGTINYFAVTRSYLTPRSFRILLDRRQARSAKGCPLDGIINTHHMDLRLTAVRIVLLTRLIHWDGSAGRPIPDSRLRACCQQTRMMRAIRHNL